jgi:DNA-binding MarR family transcriptional regulator
MALGVEILRPFMNDFLLGKLVRVNSDLKRTMGAYLEEFGLTMDAYNILLVLQNFPENSCALNELQEMDLIDKAALTRNIKRLQIAGLLTRNTDNTTGVQTVQLTVHGIDTMSKIKDYELLVNTSFSGLNSTEKKLLYNLLSKMQAPVVLG